MKKLIAISLTSLSLNALTITQHLNGESGFFWQGDSMVGSEGSDLFYTGFDTALGTLNRVTVDLSCVGTITMDEFNIFDTPQRYDWGASPWAYAFAPGVGLMVYGDGSSHSAILQSMEALETVDNFTIIAQQSWTDTLGVFERNDAFQSGVSALFGGTPYGGGRGHFTMGIDLSFDYDPVVEVFPLPPGVPDKGPTTTLFGLAMGALWMANRRSVGPYDKSMPAKAKKGVD